VDDGQPDAATAVDGQPVAGAHVGAVDERVERGDEPAAEPGHLGRRDALREADHVLVGPRSVELFGEGSGCLRDEPERNAVITDVRVTGPALVTRPVAEVERDGHAVALAELIDVRAHCDDGPGGFVTEHVAVPEVERLPRWVALPGVPVAPADAAGLRLDDDA